MESFTQDGDKVESFTQDRVLHTKWNPSRKMESFTENRVLHTRWSPSHKMESFTQDGVLHIKWIPSHKMESFTQDGFLYRKWSPSHKMESSNTPVQHTPGPSPWPAAIHTIHFFYCKHRRGTWGELSPLCTDT